MGISKRCLAWLGAAALMGPVSCVRGRHDRGAGGRAGGDHGHRREARREPAERADVHDHLRHRPAAGKGDRQLLRLRHEGAESRLRAHRRRRRHRAHHLDPRRLRQQRHQLLHRRHAAAGLDRSADPRHRPHRSAARAAGHPVRRALDGRPGAHRHQGAGSQQVQRDRARRLLGHRPHATAELYRRRGLQYSVDSRQASAAIERLRRLRGRLLQAQLLHQSRGGDGLDLLAPRRPPASPRSTTSAQLDTSGFAASLTYKATDSLTITPRFMLQRTDYNGFPMADYPTDTANGIGYPVPTPSAGPPRLPG